MGATIFMIFRDVTTRWDGQIGEIDVRSGKFRRITNDLNSYSGQSLAVTEDARQLVAIQSHPDSGLYVMPAEPNAPAAPSRWIPTAMRTWAGSKTGRLLVARL